VTRFFALFFILTMFFATLLPDSSRAADLSVNSLRFGANGEQTRIVLDLSRRTEFRAFVLQNPSRLVIDLPAFDWRAGPPAPPAGSLAGAIRNGVLQPGISRIVIDLKNAASLKSAFFLPSGPAVSDRVVMDLERVAGPYNPANDKIFGSLGSGGGAANNVGVPAPQAQTLKAPASYTAPPPAEEERSAAPVPFKAHKGPKPMIVIDAGHGGDDPGSLGVNGSKEKNVTLAVAQELARQLEASGRYRVHLTRSTDRFIKLQDRVAIGRKQGADLFISLHADSIDKPGVSGASIYTLSNKASDAQTAKLAARENQADLIAGVDLSHEDKEVANILIDLAMRDTMNQSKFFANTVVKRAQGNGIQMLEKPHRFAGFAVLKAPDVPSVLIEMGFMSNRNEVAQLTSSPYRQKIARTIVSGIDAYFAKVQKSGP
jgi:N-acetylmuramoyl-L-alanine amidase